MNKEDLFEFMKLKHGEVPYTRFIDNQNAVEVQLIDYPEDTRLKRLVVDMASSSWVPNISAKLSEEEINTEFHDILKGNSLGQAMEAMEFTFLVKGLSIHGTHALVRNRIGIAYMQMSQAVRDLRHDDILVPRAFGKYPELLAKYKELCLMSKELYSELIDTENISVADARLCLPRSIPNHIYFTCNFLTLQSIYAKRSDTAEEAVELNIMCKQIKKLIVEKFPYLEQYLISSCEKGTCFHQKKGFKANCIYKRDKLHHIPNYEDEFTLHDKTKEELSDGPEINTELYTGKDLLLRD